MRTKTMGMPLACALAAGACLAEAEHARAQGFDDPFYVTLEGGLSGHIPGDADDIDQWDDEYSLGGDATVGLWGAIVPELSVGAVVMGGALTEGDLALQDREGALDYGMFGLGLRLNPFTRLMGWDNLASGLWLGASPGVALVDGDPMPAYTASLGFNIPAGPISIGPMMRFTHFIEVSDQRPRGDVFMWTAGIEIALFDSIERPAAAVAEAPPVRVETTPEEPIVTVPPQPIEPEPEIEVEPQPEPEPELEAVAPAINDDIDLDQRVYFDFDEADLRQTSLDELDEVVAHYRSHRDGYQRLVVTGHADDRGTTDYNDTLSAARAVAVTNYLVSHGVPLEVIDVRAAGEEEPVRPDAEDELAHQLNRRVQFTVEWREGMQPEGVEPEHAIPMPEYVDAAPARVREREGELARAPEGRSRADRLLAREERQLEELVGEPVTVAVLDRSGEEPIAVRIETGAVASARG